LRTAAVALDAKDSLGLSFRFDVHVDGIDLGGWASCTGLRVDFELLGIEEGGTNTHTCWIPDRIKYEKVTLTRAMTRVDSAKVASWLASCVDKSTGGTAKIILRDARGAEVASWSLTNVLPRSWRGPELTASQASVAMETLELVHEGFLHGGG
jgi:phage tail-like protein